MMGIEMKNINGLLERKVMDDDNLRPEVSSHANMFLNNGFIRPWYKSNFLTDRSELGEETNSLWDIVADLFILAKDILDDDDGSSDET